MPTENFYYEALTRRWCPNIRILGILHLAWFQKVPNNIILYWTPLEHMILTQHPD